MKSTLAFIRVKKMAPDSAKVSESYEEHRLCLHSQADW